MDNRSNIPQIEFEKGVSDALAEAFADGKMKAVAAINAIVIHQIAADSDSLECATGYSEFFRKREYQNYIVQQGLFEARIFGYRLNKKLKSQKKPDAVRIEAVDALKRAIATAMARVADAAGLDQEYVRKAIVGIDIPVCEQENDGKKENDTPENDGKKENDTPENDGKKAPRSVSVSVSVSKSVSVSGNTTPNRTAPRAPASAPARDAPAQAPARPREAGPDAGTGTGTGGASPPRTPQTVRGDISPHFENGPETPTQADADEPFPDEEPPGTPEERAAARAAIEKALPGTQGTGTDYAKLINAAVNSKPGSRRGQPVEEYWEWDSRDPVEAATSTFGPGKWGAYIMQFGSVVKDGMALFREMARAVWNERKDGDKIDNEAKLLTWRCGQVIKGKADPRVWHTDAILLAGNGGAK